MVGHTWGCTAASLGWLNRSREEQVEKGWTCRIGEGGLWVMKGQTSGWSRETEAEWGQGGGLGPRTWSRGGGSSTCLVPLSTWFLFGFGHLRPTGGQSYISHVWGPFPCQALSHLGLDACTGPAEFQIPGVPNETSKGTAFPLK